MMPSYRSKPAIALFLGMLCALLVTTKAHAEARVLCIYDPAGKTGDYYNIMEDYAIEASSWGVDVSFKAYTDEETATKDYDAGHCDGVLATGVRLQRFNRFPSTLEAIGAISSYDILKQMISSLAKYESAAKRLRSGDHETVGFIPVGAAYLFVRNRNANTVSALAGKRMATMDYDKAAPFMVNHVGAIMVPADLGSIGPKFNNGDVDACYMSAPGYQPFELWRGLGTAGGVVRLPLAQGTLQLMVRADRFPEGFGKQSRTYLVGQFDRALKIIKDAEAAIPAKYWIDVPASDVDAFDELFLSVRLQLRDEVKAYDAQMLSALRKLRCKKDPARAECVEKKE